MVAIKYQLRVPNHMSVRESWRAIRSMNQYTREAQHRQCRRRYLQFVRSNEAY
jgi:hypothetical protein